MLFFKWYYWVKKLPAAIGRNELTMIEPQLILPSEDTTLGLACKYFPENTRNDLLKLYTFVAVVNKFCDQTRPDLKHFKQLDRSWKKALATGKLPSRRSYNDVFVAVNAMYEVYDKYDLQKVWIGEFLRAKRAEFTGQNFNTMNQTIKYMDSTAGTLSQMICKIIGAKEQAYEPAKSQARAMLYVELLMGIRQNDSTANQYIPNREIAKYGLPSLSRRDVVNHPAAYREFIEGQLKYYSEWQKDANKGYKYIPRNQRIALKVAADMYKWQVKGIAKDPLIVFNSNIYPSKSRVVVRAIVRSIHA